MCLRLWGTRTPYRVNQKKKLDLNQKSDSECWRRHWATRRASRQISRKVVKHLARQRFPYQAMLQVVHSILWRRPPRPDPGRNCKMKTGFCIAWLSTSQPLVKAPKKWPIGVSYLDSLKTFLTDRSTQTKCGTKLTKSYANARKWPTKVKSLFTNSSTCSLLQASNKVKSSACKSNCKIWRSISLASWGRSSTTSTCNECARMKSKERSRVNTRLVLGTLDV